MRKIKYVVLSTAMLSLSYSSLAQITCLACHKEENIEDLIAQRQIYPDYERLKMPEWIKIVDLGGEGTNRDMAASSHAFSQPSTGLTQEDFDKHLKGDKFFEQAFVPAYNETYEEFDGLGPVFNDNACETCHQKDGRFHLPPLKVGSLPIKLQDTGIFYRISIENEQTYNGPYGVVKKSEDNLWGAPQAVPNFSDQLFHRSASRDMPVRGVRADGSIDVASISSGQADIWLTIEDAKLVTYADGTQITLTKPHLKVDNPYDAPDDALVYNPTKVSEDAPSRLFRPDVRFSTRIGMPIFGLGLLEAIKEEDILSQINSDSRKNNGITGKANWVYDVAKHKICQEQKNCEQPPPISLGRFGWKASTPTVKQQSLAALRGDIGITNSMFGNESIEDTDLWKEYLALNPKFKEYIENKTMAESSQEFDDLVTFYTQTLAVPARLDVDNPDVIKGAQLFEAANCSACHTPSYVTGNDHEIALFHNQKIYPFTDMLLHDMGEDLADGRRDFEADGREWKTRPLWGIGKTKTVNPMAGYLHDGRAKTLEEAILWHGGEAKVAREYFRQLPKKDRDLLIQFLRSL